MTAATIRASPTVDGTALLLRADLFERLRDVVGESRFRVGVSVSHHVGEDETDTA
jgi:hypothetical protein